MAENFLTPDELKNTLVTNNPHKQQASQYAFSDSNTTKAATGLNPAQSLKDAVAEQVYYQSAVNNGLEGIEGTPTNDQIAESYQANKAYAKLYNTDDEDTNWGAIAEIEDTGLLRDLKIAANSGNTQQFRADQMDAEVEAAMQDEDLSHDVNNIATNPEVFGEDYEVVGGDISQYVNAEGKLPGYMFQDKEGNIIIDIAQRDRMLANPEPTELQQALEDRFDPDSFENLPIDEDFDMDTDTDEV